MHTDLYIDNFVDFPELNAEANKDGDFHDGVGFIVDDIQQNDQRLEDVEEHRPHRQPLQ